MSFNKAYDRLFGVRLLHNFYLDGKNQNSFFALNPATDQTEIEKRLLNYTIQQDFYIEPTADCARLLRNHKLIFKNDNHGFFVGCEVEPTSGTPTIRLPLSDGARLRFLLKLRNGRVPNFTNMRLSPTPLPSRFYFSNEDGANKNYPSVSVAVGTFDDVKKRNGGVFEMGEYCRRTPAAISQATTQTANKTNANWQILSADESVVHSGDCRALPKKFVVKFLENGGIKPKVKQIVAELENTEGSDASSKVILKTAEPMTSATLDFSTVEIMDTAQPSGKRRVARADGFYKLKISGDFTLETDVFLFDALSDSSVFGIVEIVNGVDFPTDFRWQNADKTLPSRAPMFEIRWQSRLTYRQFFDNATRTLQKQFQANPTNDFLYDATKRLLQNQKPQRLSRTPLGLKLHDLTLPEADNWDLTQDDNREKFVSMITF